MILAVPINNPMIVIGKLILGYYAIIMIFTRKDIVDLLLESLIYLIMLTPIKHLNMP